jgi:Zn-dependent protease
VNPEIIVLGITWFVVFIFSTTLHEASHAWAAHRLGDSTAYHGGQVSLNPIPHIQREPIGMILVPLISFAFYQNWMIGWASAPYDPSWAYRYPKRSALMALAGPVSNLLLAIITGVIIRVGIAMGTFGPPLPGTFGFDRIFSADGGAAGAVVPLSILFSLNLILFLFNLFPLPPLDGSAILPLFMSEGTAQRYLEFTQNPMFSLIGLLVAWKVAPLLIGPLWSFAVIFLYTGF